MLSTQSVSAFKRSIKKLSQNPNFSTRSNDKRSTVLLLNALNFLPENVGKVLESVSRKTNIEKTEVICPFWIKGDLRWHLWQSQATKYGLELVIQPWQPFVNPFSAEIEILLRAYNYHFKKNKTTCIFTPSQDYMRFKLQQRGVATFGIEKQWKESTLEYDLKTNNVSNFVPKSLFSDFLGDSKSTLCLLDLVSVAPQDTHQLAEYFEKIEEGVDFIGYMTESDFHENHKIFEQYDIEGILSRKRSESLISMALDSYDHCLDSQKKRVAIASYDSSLAVLTNFLREEDIQVLGFGGVGLVDVFRDECNIFNEINDSKEKRTARSESYKLSRKVWTLMNELGYIPEGVPKPYIPEDRLKLFLKLNNIFWREGDDVEKQLNSLSYQFERLEEKKYIANPGNRVVHEYARKIRFHPLEAVDAWKSLHTAGYINKKMRKYNDQNSKVNAIDVFLIRNSENLPGYFDDCMTLEEKLSELTILLRNQWLPHKWIDAPSEDALRMLLVRDGYLLMPHDSPYMVALAMEAMLKDRGLDYSEKSYENYSLVARAQEVEKKKKRTHGSRKGFRSHNY